MSKRKNMSSFSTMFTNLFTVFGNEEKHSSKEAELENISILQNSDNAKERLDELKKLEKETITEGDYCSFIVDYYRSLGFSVWEYSKELDLDQSKIHLVIKKEQEIFLIQCRNDNENLSQQNINSFEEELKAFIDKYQIFEQYNVKLLYTMSSLQLDESAYKYIKSSNNIDYEIVKSHIN